MDSTLFTAQKDGLTLNVKVFPNARKNQVGEIVLNTQGHKVLKILITAVPEDGKGNDALISLLATTWHLKKNQIMIKRGGRSRNKVIYILGDSERLLTHIRKPN